MATFEELMDYKVVDAEGREVGKVDHLWQDDESGTLEFVGVKTGWILGRTHIVPAVSADIEDGEQRIRVPYREEQIRNAPHIKPDHHIDEAEEQQLYEYYGISPAGMEQRDLDAEAAPATREADMGETEFTDEDVSIPLHEERMRVGKRRVPSGGLRLRKVVRTDEVREPVQLRHEEIEVERVPAAEAQERAGGEVDADAFEEEELFIPAYREEPVVSKETVLSGEVRARRRVETDEETVTGQVRSEDVEADSDVEGRRPRRE